MPPPSDREMFEKLRAELRALAKPATVDADRLIDGNLKPGGVEHDRLSQGVDHTLVTSESVAAASDPARSDAAAIAAQASPIREASQNKSVGFLGEMDAVYAMERAGELVLSAKPRTTPADGQVTNVAFDDVNRRGIDFASLDLGPSGEVLMYSTDNKALNKPSPVSRATSLQENRLKNQTALKSDVLEVATDSSQPEPVQLAYRVLYDLVGTDKDIPRIANGGSNSSGTTIDGAAHLDAANPSRGRDGGLNYAFNREPRAPPKPPGAAETPSIDPSLAGKPPPAPPGSAAF